MSYPLIEVEKYGDLYKQIRGEWKYVTGYTITVQETEDSSITFTAMAYDYDFAQKLAEFLREASKGK